MTQSAPGPQQQQISMKVDVGISEDAMFFVVRAQSGTILTQSWIPMQLADQICEFIQLRKRQAVGKIVPANASSMNVDFELPKEDAKN